MHDLIELLTRWAEDVQKLETEQLLQLLKLGGGVMRLLDLKNRLPLLGSEKRARRKDAAEDTVGTAEDTD
jgi:hypothetical protein